MSTNTGSKPYIRKLVIDDREPQEFTDIVASMCQIPIEFKRMRTGDFVCEDVCIERKEINDFANSIIDGRVFRQCDRMTKEFKYPYLLIHGRIKDIWSKILPHAIIGAMCYFGKNGITVLTFDTPEEIAYAILKVFENYGKLQLVFPKKERKKRTRKPKCLKTPKT